MYAFEFVQPATVEEAVEGARRRGGAGARRRPDADPDAEAAPRQPGTLVSLTGIAAIKGVAMKAGAARHRRRHHPRAGRPRGGGALSRARGPRRPHRRPGGQEPRHHRRQPRQQRPFRRLSRRRARLRRDHRDQRPRDRGGRLLPGHVHHRARPRRDHHRGALPDPREGELPEVPPAGLALRARRGLRGQVPGRRPRGGHRRLRGRRLPLAGGRGGAFR